MKKDKVKESLVVQILKRKIKELEGIIKRKNVEIEELHKKIDRLLDH